MANIAGIWLSPRERRAHPKEPDALPGVLFDEFLKLSVQ
jgi:hypothetical protein